MHGGGQSEESGNTAVRIDSRGDRRVGAYTACCGVVGERQTGASLRSVLGARCAR